jgi:isoamylase
MRFDGRARLIDPYAKALAGSSSSGRTASFGRPSASWSNDSFDWEGDRHLRRDLSETIIYEMHVRGFTSIAAAGSSIRGRTLGVIEKIPYLKSLGVTAVELMPVHEFPIRDIRGRKLSRPNYWGYDPLAFFAPHRGYAVQSGAGSAGDEFKQMVKALHQAGIEVILDVVFNHTCEGNEHGAGAELQGAGEQCLLHVGQWGQSLRELFGMRQHGQRESSDCPRDDLHCLRHWVHNYHIDGFRFDLASILSRDRSGAT